MGSGKTAGPIRSDLQALRGAFTYQGDPSSRFTVNPWAVARSAAGGAGTLAALYVPVEALATAIEGPFWATPHGRRETAAALATAIGPGAAIGGGLGYLEERSRVDRNQLVRRRRRLATGAAGAATGLVGAALVSKTSTHRVPHGDTMVLQRLKTSSPALLDSLSREVRDALTYRGDSDFRFNVNRASILGGTALGAGVGAAGGAAAAGAGLGALGAGRYAMNRATPLRSQYQFSPDEMEYRSAHLHRTPGQAVAESVEQLRGPARTAGRGIGAAALVGAGAGTVMAAGSENRRVAHNRAVQALRRRLAIGGGAAAAGLGAAGIGAAALGSKTSSHGLGKVSVVRQATKAARRHTIANSGRQMPGGTYTPPEPNRILGMQYARSQEAARTQLGAPPGSTVIPGRGSAFERHRDLYRQANVGPTGSPFVGTPVAQQRQAPRGNDLSNTHGRQHRSLRQRGPLHQEQRRVEDNRLWDQRVNTILRRS